MVIATRDQLIDAMANNSTRLVIDKASIANTVAGQVHSLWRATGVPAQGAIPAGAAVCTQALAGAFSFADKTAPVINYLAQFRLTTGNAATSVEIHDRLAHMGGLSGIVITAQTVGVDVSGAGNNLPQRIGDANYSDVQWFAEWYTDTGATSVNLTLAVTYDDNSTGNVVLTAIGTTVRASRMLPIMSAVAGRFIKSIQTATLSATTGTAGSFGVTATRVRAGIATDTPNKTEVMDWARLGIPEVPNSACLFAVMLASTTTTGAVRGGGKLAAG